MKKFQTTTINIFLSLLFYIEKFIFCQETYLENLVYIVTFVLQFFHVAGYWKCSKKTPIPIQICTGFVDAVDRPYFHVDFDSNGLLLLFLYISEKYLQFRKEQNHFLGTIFGSLHTNNQIYLLRNCFSNYLYPKDMYITLKGIGKILFVLVLKVFLICKFLNFTAVVTKKNN